MSASSVQDLETVLRTEVSLYARMRDLLQEEREVLLALDAERLEACSRRKAELIDEGRVVEDARRAVVARICAERGLEAEGMRLSVLCEHLGPGHAALREAHNHLVVLVSVVRELLDANRAMADRSLVEVRATIDVLGGLVPDHAGYGADGSRPQAKGRILRRSA